MTLTLTFKFEVESWNVCAISYECDTHLNYFEFYLIFALCLDLIKVSDEFKTGDLENSMSI